jgi:hypothetical protein
MSAHAFLRKLREYDPPEGHGRRTNHYFSLIDRREAGARALDCALKHRLPNIFSNDTPGWRVS